MHWARRTILVLWATTGAILVPHAGHADCQPDDPYAMPPLPEEGDTVVCTGVDSDGFGRAFIDNLSVVVQPGASVAGVSLSSSSGPSVSIGAGAHVYSPGSPYSAVNLGSTGGGSISNAGEATSTGYRSATFFGYGTNLSITNSGLVQSGGDEAPAIFVPDGFLTQVENSGQIVSLGDEASAIEIVGPATFIDNSGTIEASGLESRGIELTGPPSASLISVINSGSITTAGIDGQAIFVDAGEATVQNDGTLTTVGFTAPGVLVDGPDAVIGSTGTITTSGDLAPGLGALGGGAELTNAGTIRTTGMDASGLQVGIAFLGQSVPSDGNTLSNAGTLDIAGDDSHGLFAVGTGNTLLNGALGDVTASGVGGAGIQVGVGTPGIAVDADGNTLRNLGTITAAGADGHGMFAAGASNDVTNENTIRVDGSGGAGLGALGDGSSLSNEAGAEILVRSGAVGMRYEGDSGFATNAGRIEASASGSDGISMTGSSLTASNSGEIEVAGGGTGILMAGDGARATNQATGVITTTADGSAGIWLSEGGVIQNLGQLQTFGDDASGLVVSGGAGSGLARVTNDGTVSTIGSRSHGIEVGRSAPATSGRVNLTSAVTTEGADADGIHVDAQGYEVQIGQTGGIVTAGGGADGVELRGGGNNLDQQGEIVVTGAGAAGVRLETTGFLQSVTNSGSITSAGDAIVGSSGAELVLNTGAITGDVRLGDGSDFLTLWEGSSLNGIADGGSGLVDELEVETLSIDALNGGQFVDFETFRKTGSGLLGLQDVLSVDLALVEEGILVVEGGSTLQTGLGVTVGPGATLAGTGTVDGDIVVDPGGTVAPGLSVGTLDVSGDIMLGGALEIEVAGAMLGESDLVRVLGQADLGAGEIVLAFIGGYAPGVGDAFSFLEAASLLGLGQVALSYTGLPTGYDFTLSTGPSGLVATTSAVPEPSTLALLAGGALALRRPGGAVGERSGAEPGRARRAGGGGYPDASRGHILRLREPDARAGPGREDPPWTWISAPGSTPSSSRWRRPASSATSCRRGSTPARARSSRARGACGSATCASRPTASRSRCAGRATARRCARGAERPRACASTPAS